VTGMPSGEAPLRKTVNGLRENVLWTHPALVGKDPSRPVPVNASTAVSTAAFALVVVIAARNPSLRRRARVRCQPSHRAYNVEDGCRLLIGEELRGRAEAYISSRSQRKPCIG